MIKEMKAYKVLENIYGLEEGAVLVYNRMDNTYDYTYMDSMNALHTASIPAFVVEEDSHFFEFIPGLDQEVEEFEPEIDEEPVRDEDKGCEDPDCPVCYPEKYEDDDDSVPPASNGTMIEVTASDIRKAYEETLYNLNSQLRSLPKENGFPVFTEKQMLQNLSSLLSQAIYDLGRLV